MTKPELKIFAGNSSRLLTADICAHVGVGVGLSKCEPFPDGETNVQINEDVRGRDCFVVISTCPSVNDNLMELLIFIDALKRASAGQVIAVIPYFGYARQDRKNSARSPITAKLVANIITAAGADRILGVDFHAAQIQGFFDIPVDHLSATPVFLDHFESRRDEFKNLCLVSPDIGNVKVAKGMADLLKADLAIIDKQRVNGTKVIAGTLIGSVEGKTVLMFDDMISTASTVCEAANFVSERGALRVLAAATHAVFCEGAWSKLHRSSIEEVICTNSTNRGGHLITQSVLRSKYKQLNLAPLIGDAIMRIHDERSVSELSIRTAGTKR